MLRLIMWLCAGGSVFYFFGFIARSFRRFWRDPDGWGWLRDLWSAVVISTVLGTIALTIWLMTNVPARP